MGGVSRPCFVPRLREGAAKRHSDVMARLESAGIAVWRRRSGQVEIFLVHPGGPYWRGKDAGAWTIPKGGLDPGEDRRDAALREFEEEVGRAIDLPLVPLPSCRLRSGKTVHTFAVHWPPDEPLEVGASNTFVLEWPPHSGRQEAFPEVEEGRWFSLADAAAKLNAGLRPLLPAIAALAAEHLRD